MKDSRLLKVIRDRKLIPDSRLKDAVEHRKKKGTGTDLARILVEKGLISEEDMSKIIAESESIQVIDIAKHRIDFDAMEKLPRNFLTEHGIVPLADDRGKILLAMAEPVDLETVEEIQFMTNCLVETALAPREQINRAIEEYYSLSAHERKALAREASKMPAVEPKPIPRSPHLAEVIAEILVERGLVTREEITARLKTREL